VGVCRLLVQSCEEGMNCWSRRRSRELDEANQCMVFAAAVSQKADEMIRVDPSFGITGSNSLQDHGERRSRSESLGEFGWKDSYTFRA
jgi:hypothetical protein